MTEKPMKVAIINRSFWPVYPVIGEALLRFAEGTANQGHSVSVIMQDHAGIKGKLAEVGRGEGVHFYPAKALTTSASGVLLRACDAVFFMFWVLAVLLWVRPSKVYVSTDPPVVVPFIVMLYSRLFGAEYVYHLQDIHPEAANVVIPVNKWVYKALLKMDAMSMRKAKCLITITEQMAAEIRSRSQTTVPVHVLDNPAVSFDGIDTAKPKVGGFSFCGNAGRLQRIPLILEAIETYFERGGQLEFTFAGGGVYADRLKALADKFLHFHYPGLVSPTAAAQINADYSWALLPIEDDVTRFAFPSKSSSYVFSGANILAVCGEQTGVAQWVKTNRVGLVVKPEVEAVVVAFFDIEKGLYQELSDDASREALKSKLRFEVFIQALDRIVLE
ncbi:glycosyltransferase [uncultured Neptuniibacter sp.]|uniref:glycosyltransferase n=1 Tax=uncultured Neptuniibacter sp. TaxID=502143 RepID=UPI002631EDF9|nr:glycosyltransferase [uncultured Neptuniibacter sp.]